MIKTKEFKNNLDITLRHVEHKLMTQYFVAQKSLSVFTCVDIKIIISYKLALVAYLPLKPFPRTYCLIHTVNSIICYLRAFIWSSYLLHVTWENNTSVLDI